MKNYILILISFLLTSFSAFADAISVANVTLTNDDTATVNVSLSNSSTNIVALQFNLTLPEGIEPLMENDKVVITPSNRIGGEYILRGSKVEDGSYLFVFMSQDRTPISGKSGVLFSFDITNVSAAEAQYTASLSTASVTDLNGKETSLNNTSFRITVQHLYNLTYFVDDELYKTVQYAVGATITPEAEPTKEGYTFSGWSEIPETMPAQDVVVNGYFNINYNLTYFVDDELYKTVQYAVGATITPEAEPDSKEGHTFSGWSEIPETMPAQDVVVNGYFNINQYQVTFISDGTIIQQTTQDYGSDIVAPADPTKEGHTFTGWNPEVDATVPAHDVTYTAQFNANTYKLTYRVDDHFYKQFNVAYGATITPIADPAPKEGYTFSGWSEIPETMPAHDVVVNGYFNTNQYQVTFISDGTIIQQTTQDYGSDIVAPADPTKEGYTFTSWNPEVDATVPAHDVTYTAQFSISSYTLSYLVDGELYKEYDVEFGAAITPEDEPTQEGYTFSGWSEIPTTMPAHDVTVNGSFSPILVSSILLNETEINVYEGATFLLSASVLPENAANPILNWTSSDEKIATVVDGLVTGIRAGEVVITAESTDGSNVKALCIATVQEDDGLYKVVVDEDFEGIYTLDGRKVSAMQSGIYIVRMKDGSARIVSIK